ncbi:MocE family 2Fe-2S type ferredoxin [Granulosicoccus antarcticus]|uniref:Naphthalene 1,2-dioxygenase system ferredoxin subunit n=1 Tax=Granulosicoccus antarcticus IMCC3135 TaxID=1192854 RepID=A0A2Z2NN71_9GAMM|nr:MocE family 2Fe-2S type ferredoxin [Granulosicoccus antarcticus]ASJ71965.1 Naphthalene 1,2-dioxygenase system ferredoxin subunit [Granulosicoccus antarcticus IMCC3135]
MSQLVRACGTDEIEEEEVLRFDHEGNTFALYHGPDGNFYATDGYCTHAKAHLGDGIVDEFEIECPLHFGAFDYRTGDATVAPACQKLKTYPVSIQEGAVFIDIS